MKICPACSREYPGDRTNCADDGVGLVALSTGANARPEELLGQVVDGRYRIEQIIGKGGMGTVYLCRHVVVGKVAAMKVLRPTVERSEGVLQRFIREAQTANAIRSRHIVEMTDFGQLPSGAFYVVMELLEGTDLTRAMRSGKLARTQLLHIFIQVAETLELAHAQNIVHRDLKPDNVFLVNEAGDPMFVKILDFGIAKILHTNASGLTETGVILGTPYYMSPEQARAERIDHRSDIYALGVIMYRAFTGRLPFIADSTMGVLTRHLTEEPELPSRVAEVDSALESIILMCLKKSPTERFQSMADLAESLRSVRGEPRRAPREEHYGTGPSSQPGHAYTPASWVPGFTPSGGYPAAPSGAHEPHAASSGPYPALESGPHPAMSGAVPLSSGQHPAAISHPQISSPNPTGQHPAAISGRIGIPTPIPATFAPSLFPSEGTQRSLVTSSTGAHRTKQHRGVVIVSGAAAALAVGAFVAMGLFWGKRPRSVASGGDTPSSMVTTAVAPASPPSSEPPAPTAEPAAAATPTPAATPTAKADATAAPVKAPRAGGRPAPVPPPPPTATAAPTATRRIPPEIRSPFE